jgi:hypothetical protein
MPEPSDLRRLAPPAALNALRAAAADAGAGAPLPIIDLRDTLGDDCFYDNAHANQKGREQLSAVLPAQIP